MKTKTNVSGDVARTAEGVNETTMRPVGTAASFIQRRSFLTPATHLVITGLAVSVQAGSSHWSDLIGLLIVL